ncbi:hypothetical protein GHT06_017964 [Daphnia sinensis]|uniref:Uncharacterized protein n=1 Tax=Daphnia sinensis TaxID=1820382 RepID=A0AAD5PSP8_9CRUS|nr:hypothetical protein GHT06_017964 [Daphnia sinensis]
MASNDGRSCDQVILVWAVPGGKTAGAISLNPNALSYVSMRLVASDSFLFLCFYLNRSTASPPGVGERSQPLETKLLPDWKSLQLRCRVPFGLSRFVSDPVVVE